MIIKKIILMFFILFSLNAHALTQRIEVLGMVCAFCAQGIEKSFRSHKNINDVYVNLRNYFVVIESKNGNGINKQAITNIINDAGYDVQKIEVVSDSVSKIRNKYDSK